MKTSDFDFVLPLDRIAQTAVEPRDCARLLRVMPDRLSDHHVYDLPDLLRAGDVLVMNDTRVIPARIYGRRGEVKVEILLHKKNAAAAWLAFARPGKRLRVGDRVEFAPDFFAEILEKQESGEVLLRFLSPLPPEGRGGGGGSAAEAAARNHQQARLQSSPPHPLPPPSRGGGVLSDERLLALLHRYGEPPLPPYIKREAGAAKADRDRYQTVYAARDGAVAAPTAGLHFTPELLGKLKSKNIDQVIVTLHVGAGTFLPVKAENIKDHVMHAEWGEITPQAAEKINRARLEGRRIVCVGTTSLRVIESAADESGVVRPFAEDTAIFITPGYRFRAADVLLTNFHLPQSTLFMLVSAFMGLETMQSAYAYAMGNAYRFYSYGDACLLERE
ncbi:MAG: tRNA preQ1(34) S-adenosylmethionine ribosyltransferase-isomerase QueA [Alphaproteobacteria bacterium]|nr:tRNA preQ1(34) S-adenosylmethionine ribosyltransferase-isomerase QueA [Alphaproteobacteria bacterium]